ncbi:DNA-binding protein [Herbaspirillum huttiense]|uniref:DNA-binding protein n=1 Tax=Herbaspirillum huttiense TaxID=863372 RepID=UPI0039AF8018
MKKPPLTVEQIVAAADKIYAEGAMPTARGVLAALRSGSMTTISSVLKDWRENNAKLLENQSAGRGISLQPAVLAGLQKNIQDLIDEVRKPLEEEIRVRAEEISDLVEDGDQRNREIEGLSQQLAEAAAQKALAEGKSEQLSADLASCKAELVSVRAELDLALQRVATAEQKAAVLQAGKENLESRLSELRQDVNEARKEAREAREEAAELRGSRPNQGT